MLSGLMTMITNQGMITKKWTLAFLFLILIHSIHMRLRKDGRKKEKIDIKEVFQTCWVEIALPTNDDDDFYWSTDIKTDNEWPIIDCNMLSDCYYPSCQFTIKIFKNCRFIYSESRTEQRQSNVRENHRQQQQQLPIIIVIKNNDMLCQSGKC